MLNTRVQRPSRDHRSDWLAAMKRVEAFFEAAKQMRLSGEDCGKLVAIVKSFPAGPGEIVQFTRSVTNAARFLEVQEHGAAAYELQMLLGMLQRYLATTERDAEGGSRK